MEKLKSVRLIDELGRIVLPTEVRQMMDWSDKTPVQIWTNETKNEVILRNHVYTCIYCGETRNLKAFHNKHICPNCQKEITNL